VAIEGTIEAGDKVVIDGTDKLRDGARAEIIVPGGPARGRKPAIRSGQQS